MRECIGCAAATAYDYCEECAARRRGRRPGTLPRTAPKRTPTGLRVDHRGYVLVNLGGSHQWIYEHRLVMEEHLGRRLTPHEHVHHINEDKADNRLENLELIGRSEHIARHNRLAPKRQRASVKPNHGDRHTVRRGFSNVPFAAGTP